MTRFMNLLCAATIAASPIGVMAQDEHGDEHEEQAEISHGVEAEDHDDPDEHDEELIRLSPEELAEFGIELSKAGPGVIRNEIVVPGEIAVNGDRFAHIVPRFIGVITEVHKNVGDHVRKGDVLALVAGNAGLTSYEVTSLMDGVVIEKDATIGEVHTTDMAAFLVADLSTVWVNLSIYQMHLPIVRIGQRVAITVGHGHATQVGIISYISPVVDEHTRTATARVVLDNRTGEWRPGLLIEGQITTATFEASVVLPKTALHRIDDLDVVFVQTHEGFAPQPIVIGRTNHTSVEIIRGLKPGQVYVSNGGFTLKAAMQKGSFGDGHAH